MKILRQIFSIQPVSRTIFIDTYVHWYGTDRTSHAHSHNRSLPEGKNFSALLWIIPCNTAREKRTILSWYYSSGYGTARLLQLQLLKIHFYHESHNHGTYITRACPPTLFPRVMQRTLFRETYTRYAMRESLFLYWDNNEDVASFPSIYSKNLPTTSYTRCRIIHHNHGVFSLKNHVTYTRTVFIFILQLYDGCFIYSTNSLNTANLPA